jgi:hypothetical protein
MRAAALPKKENQSKKRPSVLQSSNDVSVGEHSSHWWSEKQAGWMASGMTTAETNWQESSLAVGPLLGEGPAGAEFCDCLHRQEMPH